MSKYKNTYQCFSFEACVFERDFMVMLGFTLLMMAFIYLPYRRGLLNKAKGSVLLLAYISYLLYLLKLSW